MGTRLASILFLGSAVACGAPGSDPVPAADEVSISPDRGTFCCDPANPPGPGYFEVTRVTVENRSSRRLFVYNSLNVDPNSTSILPAATILAFSTQEVVRQANSCEDSWTFQTELLTEP